MLPVEKYTACTMAVVARLLRRKFTVASWLSVHLPKLSARALLENVSTVHPLDFAQIFNSSKLSFLGGGCNLRIELPGYTSETIL